MGSRLTLVLALLLTAPAAFAQTPAPPAGTIEYYHVDALGSVRAVTDASGAVVRSYHYHPFGEGVGVEAGTDPLRFTGKPRDGETGLDYFGARYYATRTGRFTTVDPVMNVSALLNPERWNRYAYAGNNPIRFYDPDGRDFWEKLAGTANAIASNFGFAPRLQTSSEDFRTGQTAGDVASIFIGGIEAAVGGSIASGGTAATVTVVGAPAGVAAVAAGGALVAHGAAGSVSGIVHMSAAGEGGGATSGLSNAEARARAGEMGFKETKDAPFNSHGKPVFKSGDSYITPDRDAHKGACGRCSTARGIVLEHITSISR